MHAVQEWIIQERVGDDLKTLAANIVMGSSGEKSEARKRLALSYSDYTGEVFRRADGAIDVVTGILVAGYIASIPSNQLPLAGMIQQLHGTFNERLDNLEETHLNALTELVTQRFPIVQQLLTPYAEQELSEILSLRALNHISVRKRIKNLFKRVTEGELSAIDESTKYKIYQWTARLCATQAETLPLARKIRDELVDYDVNIDLSIVDALIYEADGDIDAALRCLRDAKDADSRSAWFGLLTRVRGEVEALEWYDVSKIVDYQNFFSATGWVNWAIASAKCGKWKCAADVLLTLENRWDEVPVLSIIEGSVNAAFLLPDDFKSRVLDGLPLYQGMAAVSGTSAASYHSRALKCFGFAENRLRGKVDDDWMKALADWILWLRLMEPSAVLRNTAREQLKAEMQDGAKAIALIPFAYSFEIPYDPSPIRVYLDKRRRSGGLDDLARSAEFIVNAQFMSPKNLLEYLEENRNDLAGVVPAEFFATRLVESILEDERSADHARKVIDQYRGSLGEYNSKRLSMMIDAYEGDDVRRKLEELYQATGGIIDLKNLITYLKRLDDREALRPLCLELYSRAPTEECAIDVVAAFADPSSVDHEEVIRFLDENEHFLEHSEKLRGAKTSALFHAGRYIEAKTINQVSKRNGLTPENLRVDLGIAIASGDWEAIGGILNDAWDLREEHDAHALVSLAHLAGQQSQTRDRGMELLKLAATKAPDDAAVLAAVYWQHFQLGHDEESDPQWLSRALELSSDEGGPIWSMPLPYIADEWLPKRRNHLIEVERKWVQGEIPISVAAEAFNVSLSRMLLHTPIKSADEPDGRRRVVVPIVAADREVTEVDEEWTVGIDVTSIMVLQYIGILDEVIDSYRHVKFSPDIFEHLFRERTEARFHQPSRIRAARKVLEVHGRGRLTVLEVAQRPPRSLFKEVGMETAEVLQSAKSEGGIVVCVLPIYSAGSLMQKQADVSNYEDRIIALSSFGAWLYNTGKIGSDIYGRICSVLRISGNMEEGNAVPSNMADLPICIDGLAL